MNPGSMNPQMNRVCACVDKSTISLFFCISVHQSGQSNFFRAEVEKWREKIDAALGDELQRSIDDSFVDLETSRFMRLHTGFL